MTQRSAPVSADPFARAAAQAREAAEALPGAALRLLPGGERPANASGRVGGQVPPEVPGGALDVLDETDPSVPSRTLLRPPAVPRPQLAAPEPRPDAAELHRRTEVVLAHLGVPPEADPSASIAHLGRAQTSAGLRRRLAIVDPSGELLGHYAAVEDGAQGRVLRVYRDRDRRSVLDFEVPLAADGAPARSDVAARLAAAARNPAGRQLAGLRVALDPGHMGPAWDDVTGKYIERDGRRVREGELNLATATALARRLRALGAEVIISRPDGDPVTDVPYEAFDVQGYGRRVLRDSAGDAWFTDLLRRAPASPGDLRLRRMAEADPEIRSLLAPERRGTYYVSGIDLDARAERINAFAPDVTIVIHYDVEAAAHEVNSAAPNQTKFYVPGGFLPGEMSSRSARAHAARHLLEPDSLELSVDLARSMVRAMGDVAGVPPQPTHRPNAARVDDGVFARNLALNRQLQGVQVFAEALFYNRKQEFDALLDPTGTVVVDGVAVPRRAGQVAEALETGLVRFVQAQGGAPASPASVATRASSTAAAGRSG